MRVLLISHTCQSRTEGQPKADCLGQLPGIDLRVLVPDRWKHYGRWRAPQTSTAGTYRLQIEKVRFPWVPGAQNYFHYYPGLRRVLEEFKPDVIDLWEEPWALVSAHTCWLRNKICPRVPIVSETEQNLLKRLPPPFEALRKYTLKQANFLVGRSHEAIEMAKVKGWNGPAEFVPNGVDPELFRPLDRAACRAKVLDPEWEENFVAGYVGRLVPEKGLAEMVEALRYCGPGVRLVFVGSGPLRADLEVRAAQLGVADRVRLLPQYPLEELPTVMNAIDALVLPSRTTARWKEQFGRVIIEAHCCGTPVIGSSSGAIPDVVGAGGLIFPERDPKALAKALDQLAADLAGRRAMAEAGRISALSNCTWQSVAKKMARIYEQVSSASTTRS